MLEMDLQGELNHPRPGPSECVLRPDRAELRTINIVITHQESRVIQQVEKLGSKFDVGTLADPGALDQGKVPSELRRAVKLETLEVPHSACAGVEENLSRKASRVVEIVWPDGATRSGVNDRGIDIKQLASGQLADAK